jgi:hypothetical protein
LSWVRACDLRYLSNVSVNLSHYLVGFFGASFRLPTRATAPTWVAPSKRFTVWGSRYVTTKTMFLPGRRNLGACP